MDYTELKCRLEPVEPWREILIAQLADIGFESFEETDYGFKAYIPSEELDIELLAGAMKVMAEEDSPSIAFDVENIKGQNWNQVWESNFEPVKISNRCYIRAPFHEPDPKVDIEIVIEPKMSFGTGHHETTYLMALWLLELDMQGKAVLDMGCGTGILAILAAKKGAQRVTAIDNHPYAYENTLENTERNNVPDVRVHFGEADLLGEESYDVIIANITKNVLMADMHKYSEVLNSGGALLLSGFLVRDREEIINHAKNFNLVFRGEKMQKDWLSVFLQKEIS